MPYFSVRKMTTVSSSTTETTNTNKDTESSRQDDDALVATTTTTTSNACTDNNNNNNNNGPPIITLSFQEWYHHHHDKYGHLLDLRVDATHRYHCGTSHSNSNTNTTNSATSATTSALGHEQPQIVVIPLPELLARSFELPPRSTPLTVLVTHPSEATLGFAQAFAVAAQGNHNNNKRKRLIPWNITGMILDTVENQQQAQALGFVLQTEKGKSKSSNNTHNNNNQQGSNGNRESAPVTSPSVSPTATLDTTSSSTTTAIPFTVQPRLWQPDPLVQHTVLPLLLQRQPIITAPTPTSTIETTTVPKVKFVVWDLGAGVGRDAAFLAEQLKAAVARPQSWQIIAMDQRYRSQNQSPTSSTTNHNETMAFFQRRGLTSRDATCVQVDLNDIEGFEQRLQKQQQQATSSSSSSSLDSQPSILAGLLSIRYWNPALVQCIANAPSIPSGTLFALSHFGLATPDTTWNFVHPKVRTCRLSLYIYSKRKRWVTPAVAVWPFQIGTRPLWTKAVVAMVIVLSTYSVVCTCIFLFGPFSPKDAVV